MKQDGTGKEIPRGRLDYAGRCGLLIGGMWTASFMLSVYGKTHPLLACAGNAMALLSLYVLYLAVFRYRVLVAPLRFPGCCKMAWITCVFAGLVTTLAQYLYFRFLDGGRLSLAMAELLHNEQYMQAMRQMMPGVTTDDLTRMLGSISIGDMTLSMWMLNLMISFPMSLIAGIFASLGNAGRNPG